ncbi:hypothetical protein BKA70DRAFT_1140574 [Coprinopsis sp. MPI-PUGE-AT-0042]|nr:hypothetical protein BKA70DRAFT_1140574 [Coprinopsis sp. MPI-PUGE-AT-0042]
MSFLKKLRRKIGERQSGANETGEHNTASLVVQEAAPSKAINRSQGNGEENSDDVERGVLANSDKSPEAGSIASSLPPQTMKISGGTFTEIGNQFNNVNIQYVMGEDDSKLFGALCPIPAAHDCREVASKVTECFAGTRHQLLQDIEKWRTSESSVPIFILDGIAGIGKTTVVKTVCARAAAERRLAASWFFSRDQQDRKSTRGFVGTLAYQLSRYHPALKDRISQALKDNPDILQKTIRAQFDTLIHEPLHAVLQQLGGTHSISIDAIDECDLDEATEILSILLGAVLKYPRVRLLITCRPERPFRLLLQRHRGTHVFHLHEIEDSVVESDIRMYINYRLSPEQVDEALPDLLPPAWRASAKEKEALVQMAGKLFLVASTAINFILDPRRLDPGRQLRQLLDSNAGSGLASSPMDRVYTQVLRAAVPDPVDDWFDDYQAVVGAIVIAADVLSVNSLASLLEKQPNEIVRTLSNLHSLVAPTNHNEAFRVHHKSFPDFVTNPSRCSIDSRFLIEASAHHFQLACGCLRVMIQMLRQNICDLPLSDWSTLLHQLPLGTISRIPPELAYACAHWISHFQRGLSHFIANENAALVDWLMVFANEHLLSWLEVVALTGRFDTAWNNVQMLFEALSLVLPTASGKTLETLSHVTNVLQDCLRFITLHPTIPQLCPMHIYLSSLAFAPRGSRMSELYARYLPNQSVAILSGIDKHWAPMAVAFRNQWRTDDMRLSPCSAMVAISSYMLRLYNVKSGAQVRQFDHPNYLGIWVKAIAFSPDGHLVGGCERKRCYIWDVVSGELIADCLVPTISRGEDGCKKPQLFEPTSITFTDDGISIVVGAADGTVFFWEFEGDKPPQHLVQTRSLNKACSCPPAALEKCYVHNIEDLIALPSPLHLISVAGSEVHFWDLLPPHLLTSIPRHVDGTHTCPISLSLDKRILAIESSPWIISLYSTSLFHCISVLPGHQGPVTTTAFASGNKELCSASQDMTVRIWRISTSTQLRIIPTSPSILTDAVFAKSVGRFLFQNGDGMVLLTDTEFTAFGPAVQPSLVRLSLDESTIAMLSGGYSVFSNLKHLTETPSFDLNSFPYVTRFFSTGELVTMWNKGLGFIEVVISNGGDQELELASFKIMGIARGCFPAISPDMTRVAFEGPESSVSVYNLYSQTLEVFLEPLLCVEGLGPLFYFSWDSSTVYVESYGCYQSEDSRTFHAASLQPNTSRSTSRDKETASVATFTKYDKIPEPSWCDLGVKEAPPAHQVHFLSEDRAWFLQHIHGWTQISLSSLPTYVEGMAYSPNGLLVAVWGVQGENHDAPAAIQLRSLPDYNLIGTLERHQHIDKIKIKILPLLPSIMVASSSAGITSWDTSTLETVGDFDFSPSSLTILRDIHPYNTTDFLCLVEMAGLESTVGLAAIRLGGALPPKVCHICWCPPHLAIKGWCLNPCRSGIIALEGQSRAILVDISKVPLPFTM